MHHVLLTRKQFKSYGVNASCVLRQGSILKAVVSMHHLFDNKEAVQKFWCQCIMCLSTGKQFKSCGVNASCFRPQGSSLKVVVSMHHVFSTRKYLKSCGVNASCFVNKKAV